jgi:hypothetical protein
MIKLYHGTNVDFQKVNLKRCRPNKDFGRGFYLTDLRNQALRMAQRRCEFEGKGNVIVQVYEFDEIHLTDQSLNVKIFEKVSEEWAKFIIENRNPRSKNETEYDVVVGPIADDGVVYQLSRYSAGFIDLKTLVKELTFKKLSRQYFFGTEKAVSYLKRI